MLILRRLRTPSQIENEYRCCMCLHVRTGTILLALFQIFAQMAVMAIITTIIVNPELFNKMAERIKHQHMELGSDDLSKKPAQPSLEATLFGQHDKSLPQIDSDGKVVEGYLSPILVEKTIIEVKTVGGGVERSIWRVENPFSDPKLENVQENAIVSNTDAPVQGINKNGDASSATSSLVSVNSIRENRYMGLIVCILSLFFSVLLLIGAVKERPSYLMPNFCLQVFDFAIACLSIVGYFSYLPDIKVWIRSKECFPFKEELLRMDQGTLTFMVMMSAVIYLTWKAYLLAMVWSLYKYLIRKINGQLRSNSISNSTGTTRVTPLVRQFDNACFISDDVEEGPIPPKYEDILNIPANAYMPPPYFKRTNIVDGATTSNSEAVAVTEVADLVVVTPQEEHNDVNPNVATQ